MKNILASLLVLGLLLVTGCGPSRPDGMTLVPGEKSTLKQEVKRYTDVLKEYEERARKREKVKEEAASAETIRRGESPDPTATPESPESTATTESPDPQAEESNGAEDEKPEADIYVSLANAYERLSRFEEAEETLKTGLEMYPNYEVMIHNLYVVYKNSAQYDKAIEQLQILAAIPGNERYLLDISEMYLVNHDKKRAAETYRKYVLTTGQKDDFLDQRIKNTVQK